jgi:hypothetical protein
MMRSRAKSHRIWNTAMLAATAFLAAAGLASCGWQIGTQAVGTIIDNEAATVRGLSASDVALAKSKLNIVYWHTSHGSQISSGMEGMDAFFGGTGLYAVGGADAGPGVLRYDDHYECDLGNPNGGPPWYELTTTWLNEHPAVNVVMWSWCGQVSSATEESINEYLAQMTLLEKTYPNVRFVYMTGHADGSGVNGNLHIRNEQIRQYCEANRKFLFNFYAIDCHDPDGNDYSQQNVTDACAYGDGSHNWALEWEAAHPDEWWQCESAHSEPLNANLKAMAAWQLWVALARTL